MPERPYTYYDFTLSLCPECLKRVDAKIVFEEGKVYMLKNCADHGFHKVLIATDVAYYKNIRNYNKPSEMPLQFNTKTHYGCPYDCGLCVDHEQHGCLTIVEVTDRCNLSCPTCYAGSSPYNGRHRTLEEIERMLDIIVANEGEPDVVQPGFAEQLATYMPDFELYLQFDSFKPEALQALRGKDLTEIRKKALDVLNRLNLSTTLVVTLQKGLNDDEIGAIIDYALQQPCVRGVTFQPTQVAGRLDGFDPATDRITLTEVRQQILEQTNVFQPNDIIPVPCNPDALAMAYAIKAGGQVLPMTRYIDPADLLDNSRNTIVYEQDAALQQQLLKIFSTGISVDRVEQNMNQLLCCIPRVEAPGLTYNNLFRIIIMRFIDAWDFDVRAIKKSCVHIVHKDGRVIPFETMNLFYRDEKEAYLKKLTGREAPSDATISLS
ncbi:MAG: radical SAM protein [Sphingobacteriales bacterium]|nr:MAG: radical SAM protein [Sphingobacteriales bacterium]